MAESHDSESGIDKPEPAFGKKQIDKNASSRSYLLELPAEIRIEICKFALFQAEGAHVNLKTGCVDRKEVALTTTNKQLRQDCGNLYFKVNTFVFSLTYIRDTEYHLTYDWFDEQATFNYFIRRYAADLQEVRIQFKGLSEIQHVVDTNGRYFLENLQALRTSFAILRSNKVRARILMYLDEFTFDLTLGDRTTTEDEINDEVMETMADEEVANSEYGQWVEEMQQIVTEVLYDEYRKVHF